MTMKNASTLLRLTALSTAAAASLVITTGCAAPGGDAFSKAPVYSPSDAFRGPVGRRELLLRWRRAWPTSARGVFLLGTSEWRLYATRDLSRVRPSAYRVRSYVPSGADHWLEPQLPSWIWVTAGRAWHPRQVLVVLNALRTHQARRPPGDCCSRALCRRSSIRRCQHRRIARVRSCETSWIYRFDGFARHSRIDRCAWRRCSEHAAPGLPARRCARACLRRPIWCSSAQGAEGAPGAWDRRAQIAIQTRLSRCPRKKPGTARSPGFFFACCGPWMDLRLELRGEGPRCGP
mgnify:CR=1 FL=1